MTALLLVAELVLVLATLCAVVGHAGALSLRARRREPVVATATRVLVEALDAPSWEGAPPLFVALRRHEHVSVLTTLASSLHGRRRVRLRAAADDVGLLAHAHRRGRSRLWWRRLEAARLLTVLGGGERVMLGLLEDRREEVRAQAIEWAGYHPGADTVDRLVDRLEDPATLCRFTVKQSLLQLGRTAVPAVHCRLAAQEGALPDLLEVASWSADPSYLEPAVALTSHPDPAVRRGAVRVLGALGGSPSSDPLMLALADPEPQVRAAAAEALGRLAHWPAAALLRAQLRDRVWEVRKEAGLALARLGAPGQLVLRRALADEDPFAADMARLVLEVPVAVSQREP